VSGPLQTVHVRVNDAATGQPTPVLIRFTDPDGNCYTPFGRLTEFATGRGEDVGGNLLFGAPCAYIDGTCEVRLPVGRIVIEGLKGPEYEPLSEEVHLGPGKLALRLTVKRWADARQERWYSGDTQAYFLGPHAALLEAAAQDLAVVNLLALEVRGESRPPALPNLLAFSGQRPAQETAGHLVAVNTLNTHPVLGQLALLNCHRVVYPLTFGGPHGYDDWTLADWCDQCHRKGGLVVAADFFRGQRWVRGEVIADLILGKIDALDVAGCWCGEGGQTAERLGPWYQLLNAGLRAPLVAGSGKDANAQMLGWPRTYARLAPGEGLTYQNWVEAVRKGRTFVTDNSALLFFQVNGRDPGAVLDLPASDKTVHVRAEARGRVPPERLEVIANGVVVAAASPSGPYPTTLLVEADIPVTEGGWLAARCGVTPSVHTSPVYVRVGGPAPRPDPDALAFIRGHLDGMLEWVAREGRFENDKQRQRLAGIFHSALKVLPLTR
jgi:hypothetical protein